MRRTPLKKKARLMRRGSLRRKAKLAEEHMKDEQEMILNHTKMWEDLYKMYISLPPGERKCQSCGRSLANEPRSYYFDHLIEKSKRPDLALERSNIFLCCLECHALKTDGHPTDPHRDAIEKAKEKFGIN